MHSNKAAIDQRKAVSRTMESIHMDDPISTPTLEGEEHDSTVSCHLRELTLQIKMLRGHVMDLSQRLAPVVNYGRLVKEVALKDGDTCTASPLVSNLAGKTQEIMMLDGIVESLLGQLEV